MTKLKLVRRSQTLSPFGVGAIMDVEGESFVAMDAASWGTWGDVLTEPRLERLLAVKGFRTGAAAKEPAWDTPPNWPGVPFYRFPRWLFCPVPTCRWMRYLSRGVESPDAPRCQNRSHKDTTLAPMRFVLACPRGHLDDVPWVQWAHSTTTGSCRENRLSFLNLPGGSGLEFLLVRCNACKARRSLRGITGPDSMSRLQVPCPGRQPWEVDVPSQRCNAVPRVLQRGASNLTFSAPISSIDIPPFSDWSYAGELSRIRALNEFKMLLDEPPDSMLVGPLIEKICRLLDVTDAEVRQVLEQEQRSGGVQASDDVDGSGNQTPMAETELLPQEYGVLIGPDREHDVRDNFIKARIDVASHVATLPTSPYADAATSVLQKIGTVAEVPRLREVRALLGFSRLSTAVARPDDEEQPGRFQLYNGRTTSPRLVPADLGKLPLRSRWLPAIEVFGEGIFLALNEPEVAAWEQIPEVRTRVAVLAERAEQGWLQPPTARLVMIHTLAHLLIRQLSFECGYSLASLRERLYAVPGQDSTPMAGLMIYTAAGDAEGTLGGLVREAQPDRIVSTILKAVQAADWCSSDPLCRESTGQGLGSLNLAACHACALVPETSCTLSNRLLDRQMVIGTTDHPELGYLGNLVDSLARLMGSERLA